MPAAPLITRRGLFAAAAGGAVFAATRSEAPAAWSLGSDRDHGPALRRAIERLEVQGGGTLTIPREQNILTVSEEIELPSGIEIVGIDRPVIRQAAPGKRLFFGTDISRIAFRGLRLQGAGSGAMFEARVASNGLSDAGLVDILATSADTSSDIVMTDCELTDAWSLVACQGRRIRIGRNNRFGVWRLYAVLMSQTQDSACEGNRFFGCTQSGGAVAYACQATGNPRAGFPLKNFSFSDNVVEGVPSWDAFMSHSGENISVRRNVIRNCRSGIDITSNEDPIVAPIVEGNDITATASDTWRGGPALHAAIAVRAEIGANGRSVPTIGHARVRRNVARGFGGVPGLVSSGNAVGAISLENVGDSEVVENEILDFGDETPSYRPISVYRPGNNILIAGNQCSGATSQHMIVIEQFSAASSCAGLSIRGNRFEPRGVPDNLVRLHSGAYVDFEIADNVGRARNPPYDLTGLSPSARLRQR